MPSLGERLKAIRVQEEIDRQAEQARKKAKEQAELAEAHEDLRRYLADVRAHIEGAIAAGKSPEPHVLGCENCKPCRPLGMYSWPRNNLRASEVSTGGFLPAYHKQLWLEFVEWLEKSGLTAEYRYCHGHRHDDEYATWYELTVEPR